MAVVYDYLPNGAESKPITVSLCFPLRDENEDAFDIRCFLEDDQAPWTQELSVKDPLLRQLLIFRLEMVLEHIREPGGDADSIIGLDTPDTDESMFSEWRSEENQQISARSPGRKVLEHEHNRAANYVSIEVNHIRVYKRCSDLMVNANQILKAADVKEHSRKQRLRCIKNDQQLEQGKDWQAKQGGIGRYQGVWVTNDIAESLCREHNLLDRLAPLLDYGTKDQRDQTSLELESDHSRIELSQQASQYQSDTQESATVTAVQAAPITWGTSDSRWRPEQTESLKPMARSKWSVSTEAGNCMLPCAPGQLPPASTIGFEQYQDGYYQSYMYEVPEIPSHDSYISLEPNDPGVTGAIVRFG